MFDLKLAVNFDGWRIFIRRREDKAFLSVAEKILDRDNYTCQYCGTTEQPLTIDHVLPRSKGGKTEWTNVVAACGSCNRRKANRLPTEARMTLRSKPIKPGYIAVALLGQAKGNEVWERYIQP